MTDSAGDAGLLPYRELDESLGLADRRARTELLTIRTGRALALRTNGPGPLFFEADGAKLARWAELTCVKDRVTGRFRLI